MRKTIIPSGQKIGAEPNGEWLDLESEAEVEITSEDPAFPIENALVSGSASGWRAAEPGVQTIRLLFTKPRHIQHIQIHFKEPQVERTQQFVLRWSPDNGQSFMEIVRQQWNFSPQGIHEETESICRDIHGVTILELTITPDIGGGDAVASLARLRVG